MKDVTVPTFDVNSDRCTVLRWLADDRAQVRRGDVVVEVETSKALLEIEAPADGFLLHERRAGQSCMMTDPVAKIFETAPELEQYVEQRKQQTASGSDSNDAGRGAAGVRATKKAIELAAAHGIDLASIADPSKLVQQKDVEQIIAARSASPQVPAVALLPAKAGTRRILLVGAGYGATQVLEIMRGDEGLCAVGAVDDKAELWGKDVYGVPVVGGTGRIESLFRERQFDAAVITISTSVQVRKKLRELLAAISVPLENVIDPSCRVASDAKLGTGNVLCAFCHVGTGTVIGDNNFFSAYNSVDHHCTVGSDCSTGPGCMFSGLVTVGSRLRLGTGIFIEPYLSIGDDVAIASGSIILRSIPAQHTVKSKVGQTVVVPQKS